jgi:hypothetical protein
MFVSMNDASRQQDDRWNWLVIGLIVSVVVAALYGPLVWEITRGASASQSTSDLVASQTVSTAPGSQRATLQF